MVQGRNLALQNIFLKTECETKASILKSQRSAMPLGLALVKLLYPPSEIMRSVRKWRAPALLNPSSGKVTVWGGRSRGEDNGAVRFTHTRPSACSSGQRLDSGSRGTLARETTPRPSVTVEGSVQSGVGVPPAGPGNTGTPS